VEQQTLGEIAAAGPQGSLLLYGRELLQQGLPCLMQPRLLESWANGTNTEVGRTLTHKTPSQPAARAVS
jgi:hypothetical protein